MVESKFRWKLVRFELPEVNENILMINKNKRMFLGKLSSNNLWVRDNGEVRSDIIAWCYIVDDEYLDILLQTTV